MIDLHIHSTASDGEYTAQELIDNALNLKITSIAITDHDTADSLYEAENYAKEKDILFIPGIEMDAKFENGKMHILGYFIDYNNEELKNELELLKKSREYRTEKFIEEFEKLGFEISIEEVKREASGNIIGKPHFAKAFVKKGYINEVQDLFTNYFDKEPFKSIPKHELNPKEIIKLLKQANAIVVLAHPHSLKLDNKELEEKILELKSYGLDGIECYHSNHSIDQINSYIDIAKRNNLLITKGSDFHGPIVKPKIKMGTGINENILSENEDKILEDLLVYHRKIRFIDKLNT